MLTCPEGVGIGFGRCYDARDGQAPSGPLSRGTCWARDGAAVRVLAGCTAVYGFDSRLTSTEMTPEETRCSG